MFGSPKESGVNLGGAHSGGRKEDRRTLKFAIAVQDKAGAVSGEDDVT